MTNEKTVEQARFIASAGRKLKDHVFSIQSGLHSGRVCCQGEELSTAQVQMLMTLHGCGKSTISHLAEKLNVSPPSASCMVDRLEDKGFVHRERSIEDRRKVVVHLSKMAAVQAEKMEEAVLAAFLDLVEKVGPETAQKWCEVLERVEQVLSKQERVNDHE
ncbi:transcriptional regulator [Desulfocapsa sulfexigens DSM 10523]|uniref:Transcriptional regulator n=1 Tax=Desulfocapsa sulfexigens (strain DSM 10523 / SB164P1) TaxID=1167006 RepID=M1P1L2_DESSD|nr:MarR family transcriptional regulator [Desulfocapsa sulfexigens]AGF77393.1 transcriptional regulator [Desulfocapsa sulfexigens DSM 10523]